MNVYEVAMIRADGRLVMIEVTASGKDEAAQLALGQVEGREADEPGAGIAQVLGIVERTASTFSDKGALR